MARDTSQFNSIKYGETQPIFGSEVVRIKKILNMIGSQNSVLDIGCWDGSIGKLIMKHDNKVYGLENSTTAVVNAREKGIIVNSVNLELDAWPTYPFSFDVVFAGEIIEHVFDTDKFLQNIRGVLKDKGHLVLTTPNIAALGRRLMLLFGLNPLIETTARKYDGGHIRYFTKKTLFALLQENGFSVKEYCSDVVNFSNSGNIYSSVIPRICPTLGRSLIVKCEKQK